MADRPADNLQELPQQIQRMLDHYRLVDNPFGKAVDAKVFSRTGNRAAVAAQIERLFRSTATECLLIAPPGGGKRTLARQVARQLGVGWRLAWVDGWEVLDAVDLVRELVAQLRLGQKVEGTPEEMSRQIAELVARKAAGGENCLLVVQHADQLTPEMQRWLRSLGRHGGRSEMRLRQLWLAESAQPIEQADEGHQWTATELEPLTDAEALEYLRDRFAAAGRFEDLPIEESEVARLNRIAGGWPGRLNEAARDYLIAANKRALEWRVPTGLMYGVIGIAVLTAVAVTMVRYLPSQPGPHTTAQSGAKDAEPAAPDQAAPDPDPAVGEPDAGGQRSNSEREPDSATAGEDVEAVPATGEQSNDSGAAATGPEPIASAERDAEPVRPDEDDAQPTLAGEGGAEPSASQAGDTGPTASDESEAEATPADPDDARAEAADARPVYTVQLAGARSVDSLLTLWNELDVGVDTSIARTTLDGEPWYVLIAGRHETVAQARDAIAALPPEIRARSPWPRALSDLEVLESPQPSREGAAAGEGGSAAVSAPSGPFTLQLAGVRNRGSLEALVAELENPERYEIMTTTLEGRPWYVLTHGRFETAEAARAAMERLPQELKRNSPWPRPLSDFAAPAAGQED